MQRGFALSFFQQERKEKNDIATNDDRTSSNGCGLSLFLVFIVIKPMTRSRCYNMVVLIMKIAAHAIKTLCIKSFVVFSYYFKIGKFNVL
mmetsp:Transcript_18640/g.38220  ORF Transcript_18640/g.38220 Transcript_18640/m.38220 type:complete len:90 (+) Transcript_18640:297-566(+)